jgi:hypothetical protein
MIIIEKTKKFMKAQAEEFFYLATIVFSAILLIIFLSYQQSTRGKEVLQALQERIYSEELADVGSILFNSKLPFFEKYYIQAMIDGILQGKDYSFVYYGKALNTTNITQILEPLLDQSFKGRWRIEVILPKDTQVYGELKKEKVLYSWENLIPVPDENVGKIILSIGG